MNSALQSAIDMADAGALNLLLTTQPELATEDEPLAYLCMYPPAAEPAVLGRMAQLLLHAGANPNDRESLYHACEHPHHAVLDVILASPRLEGEWLTYCLARKLDFEDIEGIVKMLQRGADPNRTPEPALHHAVRRGRSYQILEALLRYGADPFLKNAHGHTARQLAIRYGRTDLGEGPEITAKDRWLGGLWRQPAAGPAPAPLDEEDYRLLPEAAYHENLEAVRSMLMTGFPVDSVTHDRTTAMDFARWLQNGELVELLRQYGASERPFADRYLSADLGTDPLPMKEITAPNT